MAAEGRLLFHIAEFERKLDIVTRKSAEASSKVKAETRGLGDSLSSGLGGVGGQIMGAFSVGAVAAGVKGLLGDADDIADLSIKLNENAEAIQRVDHAAKIAGAGGVEQVASAMLKLERNLGMVENSKAEAALLRFGLSGKDLMAMPLDEKIAALSGAFQAAREDGTGVADLMDLVGRSGAELIPLLGMAKEELDALFRDAPVLAEAQIVEMAKLNDQLDGIWAKMKGNWGSHVATMADNWQWFKDLVATGSSEEADLRMVDRDTDATRAQYARREAQQATAEAAEEQRAAAAAAEEEKKAADELADSLEKLAATKERLEKDKIDLLPDDEKLAALKTKLASHLEETVGMFSLKFEQSLAGLEALAKSREENASLPGEGVNSAAEAYEWLEAGLALKKEEEALEQKIADKKKAAAEAKAKEIDTLREKAEAGAFELLDPEEQARQLTQQLGKSFGFDITGVEDVERGLAEARQQVREARESGDTDAEKKALERLNAAQDAARDLASLTTGTAEDAAVNGRGTVAGAVANIFGRSSADLQLDESKAQTTILGNIERLLSEIKSEPGVPLIGDPIFTYP